MGAALRFSNNSCDDNYEDIDDDVFLPLEWLDKSTQTEVCLPTDGRVNVFYDDGDGDGTLFTEEIHIDINTDEEGDRNIEKMQQEIKFLKAELDNKQNTITNLLELLKSNLDITKEISRCGLSSDSSDITEYESSMTRSEPNSHTHKHWDMSSELREQLVMLQRRTWDGTLRTPLTSTTYDIFIDSLEE